MNSQKEVFTYSRNNNEIDIIIDCDERKVYVYDKTNNLSYEFLGHKWPANEIAKTFLYKRLPYLFRPILSDYEIPIIINHNIQRK